MRAAELGDVDKIRSVVRAIDEWDMQKQWMTQADKKGRTPLHIASMYGYMNVVKFIIKEIVEATQDMDLRKQYINMVDLKGRTPLFHAAANGMPNVVRYLIERGADLEAATNENHIEPGSTPLMASAEKNAEDCFQVLLDKGANVLAIRQDGADAAYMAARYGHRDIIDHIAATDKMKLIVNRQTFRGRTPILTAAFHGHLKVCKLLYDFGADLDHQDEDKFTALIYAANEGHFDLAKWLAERGANVRKKDRYGETALTCADANAHVEIATFLRKYNSDLEQQVGDKKKGKNVTGKSSSGRLGRGRSLPTERGPKKKEIKRTSVT